MSSSFSPATLVFRLKTFLMPECSFCLVVQFHVPSARKAGVWVLDLDSLLTSQCYRRVGSASPPGFQFQVTKTWFSLEGSALLTFFFRLGFKSESFLRIRRFYSESLLWKARCSRLYEQVVGTRCFTKSSLLGGFGSWHVCYEQPGKFDCFAKSSLYFGKLAALGFTDIL
jgi:hypothetical protein